MGDRVKGKVAIVTGAGSTPGPGIGNGKASAIVYAREGAKVMLVDLKLEAAQETEKAIRKEGGECFAFKGDVSKATDCKAIVEKCIQAYGRIDILHNNVGIEIPGGVDEMTEENWDKTMNVNLKSMFLMCKYALPHMEKQGSGSVINISSINAIRNLPYISVAYSASKAGLDALTRELAMQYAARGIRVNSILPGLMDTPLVVAALTKTFGGDVARMKQVRSEMVPMRRQGEAWDTAYLALFLASDESKYITGTTILVDGGLSCCVKPF